MSYCATCIDAARDKNMAISDRTEQAKRRAIEQGKPQAICKDEINQAYFIVDAATAFQQHFFIEQVVSGLPG